MEQDKLIKLQLQMKQNNEDYKDFLDGIESWSEDIKDKEKKIMTDKKGKVNSNNNSFPIRNSVVKPKKLKDQKIKAYDYKAWDKFDVEKALNESAESDDNDESSSLERISRLVNEHREVGNIRFKEGNYVEATSEYTKAIAYDSNNALLFTNRAMSLFKMGSYEAAEVDCCRAIEIDNISVKAYYRRAKCRMLLQKDEEALDDLYVVLRLNPENKVAKKELSNLEKSHNIRGIVEPIFGRPLKGIESSKPLMRVNVIDVDPNKLLPVVETKDVTNFESTTQIEEMPKFSVPSTSAQFSRDLNKYRRNPFHLGKFLSLIDHNMYRKLIGISLDCTFLQNIIDGLSFSLKHKFLNSETFVVSVNKLTEVERFSPIWLMMSDDDKCAFTEAVSMLDPSLKSSLKIH